VISRCRDKTSSATGFRRACLACLELALGALVDPPVRPGMAHVAVPEDEGGVGLDHLERVFALSWLGHCEGFVCDWGKEIEKSL